MNTLPDPVSYAGDGTNPLVALAEAASRTDSALQHGESGKSLLVAVETALASGDDEEIRRALRAATSATVLAALHNAIEQSLEPAADSTLAVRLFAVPLVIVTGGMPSGKIPGVVHDTAALQDLFESHGALGQARNFGLGNALVNADTLSGLSPGWLYRASRSGGMPGATQLELAPADIELVTADEQAHLRFLAGAVVTPRNAPGFTETAGNIGAWGMPLTRALADQLAQPGLSVLPIPRPPLGVMQAVQAGLFAWRELGFQLFLSNALRRFRSRIGEPDVSVAAYADASVRVRLDSRLDETLKEEYRWQLDPGDDFAAVSQSIFSLLAECRLDRVDVLATVQPVSASH